MMKSVARAENFNLHCIVHAPFLLVDSRQQLKDDKVNSNLKSKLAELASEALLILRDYGLETGHLLVTENIFNFIPPKDNRFYTIADNIFRDEYISLLEKDGYLDNISIPQSKRDNAAERGLLAKLLVRVIE